jgi:hypothetical protein
MKRTLNKKLSLHRETLRTISGDPFTGVVGGVIQTLIGTCETCYYERCSGFNCSDNCTVSCPSTPDAGC